jgi:type IV pilus assembly protein PilB
MSEDYLQRLIDEGVISQDQMNEAESMASNLGITAADALVRLGYVSSGEMGQLQAAEYGHEFVNLDTMEIPASVIALIPESVARENIVIPLGLDDERLRVALTNVNDLDVIDKLRFMVNREIEPVGASKESIQNAINRYYGASETESVDSMLMEFTETAIDFTETETPQTKAEKEEENAPVVRLCNLIISEAVSMRASDIHIEPFDDRIRIRYRIDGVLVERDSPPRRLLAA